MYKDISLLLVEDKTGDSARIQHMLRETAFFGAKLMVRKNPAEALAVPADEVVHVVLLIIPCCGGEGIEILRQINLRFTESAVIVLCCEKNEESALSVLREGAQHYLAKGDLNAVELDRAIRFSIERNSNLLRLKKSYKALQLSEQRFVKLFHHNPVVAMTLSTFDGTITEVNEVFLKISEYTAGEVIGKKSRDLNLWVNENQRVRYVAQLKQGVTIRNKEVRIKTKSGKFLDILFSMDVLEMESGQMIMSTANDITDRLVAEKKLREIERGYVMYADNKPWGMNGAIQDIDQMMKAIEETRRLSLVASKTDNLVIITDAEEKIEWVNESFVKRMGYTLEEVMGKDLRDFFPGPDTDRPAFLRILEKLRARVAFSEEILTYSKDRKAYWLKININPVFGNKGELLKFIAVITDVSLHKEYEKNITAIAREQSLLIGNANAIIFGVDRNCYVNEWNKLAAISTGFSKNEVLEKKLVRILIDPVHRENTQSLLDEVLAGNPVSRYEFPIISSEGEKRILLLSATPRRNASEEIVGLLAVGQDITELTQYKESLEEKVVERTRELEVALEKEKELATLKSRFASMVSHEFRTPLSTIRLSASHLKKYRKKLTDEEIDEKIATVHQQVEHMTHMLEDILTLGKSDDRKIQILKGKLNVHAFLSQIIEEVENTFNRSHHIKLSLATSTPEIETDDALLRNIFINLLNNAIKFSPDRQHVYVAGRNINGHLVIDIRDEGLGIPLSDMKEIFDPFHRGSNVETIQGTGLGLSIVKKAVDLVGGSVAVSSEPGKGSVFTVRLPVK